MQNTYRAYNPRVDVQRAFRQQQTATQLSNVVNLVNVPRTFVYRKIYVWCWSSAATWAIDYDVVGLLGGVEVYRQKLAQYTTAANSVRWYSSIAQVTQQIGAVNEQLFTYINNVQFGLAPWRHNMAVDQLYIAINSINDNGQVSLFDAGLMVISQAGI